MNKNIYILVGIVVIVGLVYVMLGESDVVEGVPVAVELGVSDKGSESMVAGSHNNPDQVIENSDDKLSVRGSYEAYTPETLADVEGDTTVLFFHATWCPSCKALDADIEKNVNTIPEGLTILKIDYDEEVELKKKYGVTTQHTLVQVDADGEMIKKWSGGTYDTLLAQVN